MIFPELAGRIKGWISEHNDGPTTLGLKDAGYGYGQLSSPAEWYQRNGWYGIAAGLSAGAPTWAGERVTLASALNHSVVWACNRAISEPVGFLPLNLMRRTDRGKEFATSHPMYSALHDSPNDEMSAQSFRETLTSHALLQGNGYAQILRRSGTGVAIELRALNPQQVNVDRDGQGRLVYVISDIGNSAVSYTVQRGKPQDIFHLKGIGNNGIIGYSVLQMARESIGTGLAAERTVARFFAAGGRVPYILDLEHKFATDQDRDKFRADWETIYSQPHRAPILPPGIKYQQIGLNHADAQMLEQRQFTIPEIARWFNVSPHLVGDLSRSNFSNVEQMALDHIKFCLSAWFTRWESELFRCILTPQEKASGYYFKHNVNALLRGDFASRMAGYATSLQNGYKSIDEVRDLEDDNPLPDGAGESYHIQMNMATVPGTGDPMIAEQAQLLKITDAAAPEKPAPAADNAPAQLSAAKKEIDDLSLEMKSLLSELKKQQAIANQPVIRTVHRNKQGLIERIEEVRKDK